LKLVKKNLVEYIFFSFSNLHLDNQPPSALVAH
jgi:hypothetical protein